MQKICCIFIWRILQLILVSNLFPYGDGQFQLFNFEIIAK